MAHRSATTRLIVISGLLYGHLVSAPAQDLDSTRPQVLRVLGSNINRDIDLFPLERGPGIVFRELVPTVSATALRLSFEVRGEDPDPESWALRIVNPDDESQVYEELGFDDVVDRQIWSDLIPDRRATVLVLSDKPDNAVRIRLNEVIVFEPRPAPLGITGGSNDMAPIGNFDPWVIDMGKSVARIIFSATDGNTYGCTGFLVTADLMLTNHHCIATQKDMNSAIVDFDYDSATSAIERVKFSRIELTDQALDYSFVRLRESQLRTPLLLSTAGVMTDEELLVIQHPEAGTKLVSRVGCRVLDPEISGEGAELTDFSHFCDTLGSSSGSPVISFDRQAIVGLHHLTFDQDNLELANKAVKLELILDAIPADMAAGFRFETP
jgi:hypothetical protein